MRAESLVHPATATGVVGIDASSAIRRELAPGVEVEIIAIGPDDRLHLRRGEHLAECATEGRSSWRLRDACLDGSLERICVVQDVRDSGDAAVVTLAVRTLGPLITADRIRFLFDERIEEGVRRIGGPFAARNPGAWLAERCILPPMRPGGASRLLFARGGEILAGEGLDRPFSIVGDGIRLDVHLFRPDLSDDPGTACVVTRLSAAVRGRTPAVRAVLEADVDFVNRAEDAVLSAQVEAQLNAIARSEGTLLNLWRRYQDIEIEATERKAEEHPTVPYVSREDRGEGMYRLEIPEESAGKHRLAPDDEVGLLEQNRTPEQIAEMMRGSPDGGTAPPAKAFPKEWPATVERIDRGGRLVMVRCDGSPPESGFLAASISGDARMQQRRRHALDLIRHDHCSMKQLGLMLEEIGPLTTRRPRAEQPVTARLLERVFTDATGRSWQPTAAQRAAIDAALNTPDIAVIQGPPGTGKTTVMRASIERIHELNSKDPGRRDRFLVTGFQHDAVENATDGLEVDGVPALKAGGRRGKGARAQEQQDDLRIDEFVDRILRSSTVLARSAMKAHAELREIDEEIARFTAEPHSAAATVAMIDSLRTKFSARLSRDLDESLAELGERMRRDSDREADPDMERLERAIRAIRCSEVAFADDGPETAALALFLLRRAGTAVCLDALERAGAVRGEPGPDLLEDLGSLRHRLLLTHVRRRGGESLAFRNDDLLALLEQVRTEMRDRTATTSSADEIAMARFRESLEDREALREALNHYSMVIGATCQQSVAGFTIERLGGDAEALTYENVLCDEAARANPLDLLIPMSRAKQRIILVGDHRQLPHIVEDSIEERLLSDRLESVGEGESAEQVRAEFIRALETSLFERIRSVLVERERKDGYRRVVTLNQQFRMHPTLGEFVSDRFYPPEERFSSPRPASDFVHGCRPFLGRCAAWHDVPGEAESFRDKSRVRSIEAREIARLLKGMLDDTDGAGATTTFGIITFYRAQVDEIDRELVRVGIKIAREHGEPQLAAAYEGRVRVGTVDAFQGREFDVVFLSVVRSNGKEEPVKRYGHLMSPNRMCVSMSRQKRLLVVVGDRRILGKTAERDVPALHAFAKLADDEADRVRRAGGGA